MEQLPLFTPSSLSVSEITRYLRQVMESDPVLQDVWVLGEISNLSKPSSGHLYFTLKDANAALRCVIWRNTAVRLRVPLQNGSLVEAHGSINLYERDGQYQLYIDTLRPAGEGQLYLQFLQLKEQLEAEGLFALERKRPLPAYPQRIGLVTSPTGAALQDMLNTLRHRYPLVEVILAPCAVQGNEAPPAILAALDRLNCLDPAPDVILVARGGGSLEDLWPSMMPAWCAPSLPAPPPSSPGLATKPTSPWRIWLPTCARLPPPELPPWPPQTWLTCARKSSLPWLAWKMPPNTPSSSAARTCKASNPAWCAPPRAGASKMTASGWMNGWNACSCQFRAEIICARLNFRVFLRACPPWIRAPSCSAALPSSPSRMAAYCSGPRKPPPASCSPSACPRDK
jgi:hypothetical protein